MNDNASDDKDKSHDDSKEKLQSLLAFEQASATLAENLPPMWMRIFGNCVLAGFTKEQAFQLVMVAVNAQMGGKVMLP